MKKTDITEESLCIKKIISVIQGKNTRHHNLLSVNGRHSDAFVYIITGCCTYRFDDQTEFQANAGDVFYLPYKSVYTMYIHTENYEYIFCDFEFLTTEPRYSSIFTNQKLKNMDNLFAKLLNLHHSSSASARTERMSVLYSIYSILQQDSQKNYLGKNNEINMLKAKKLIDESFNLPEFSISLLAEKVGISEVYLRKLFKAQYGITPSSYLISIRLNNAKKLMKYPFLTLEECALQCGFSSLQYFCRLFKKEIGISPGKYRKDI